MAFFVCVIFVSAFAVVILHDVTSKRERECQLRQGGYLPPHKHEGGRSEMRGESNPEALTPPKRIPEPERESGEVIADEDQYDDADEVE